MDVERHEVSVEGTVVRLALKEFDLLEVLLRNAGRVMTRASLIDRVWGADYVGDTKTLDVHIKRLRAKIEDDPSRPVRITTVRGLGYKFQAYSNTTQESSTTQEWCIRLIRTELTEFLKERTPRSPDGWTTPLGHPE